VLQETREVDEQPTVDNNSVAVCVSLLQCAAVCCRKQERERWTTCLQWTILLLQCVAVCCSVLQETREVDEMPTADNNSAAVCFSLLQCAAVCCRKQEREVDKVPTVDNTSAAVCCSVLQCVAGNKRGG